MYCVPAAWRRVGCGGLPFCNSQIRIVKSTRFVEIIQSAILRGLLFSGNKPHNPDCDWYIGIFKNKRTYDDVNKIKNPKCLDFSISVR